MQNLVMTFLDSLKEEKGYSHNTIVAYQNDLTQFCTFMQKNCHVDNWSSVSPDNMVTFVNDLRYEREYASATVARKVAAAKSFFHFLCEKGFCQSDPTSELDSPKVRKYSPVALTEEEVERLLKAPQGQDTIRSYRDAALLEMLYATGMRVSEIVALDVCDVDLQDSCVHCESHSNRVKARLIPIYSRAAEALDHYLCDCRPKLLRADEETALFLNHRGKRLTRQGLWLIIRKYVEDAGIQVPVTPHTLRHSFATHLLSGGADVHEVQGLLGHANVSTTQVYTQMTQEQIRELYEEAHPRAH